MGCYVLISKGEVVRLKMPYPDVSSQLAIDAHMYICYKDGNKKEFVKCQSFKPYHLSPNSLPKHRIVENPDAARNIFKKKSIIDCDKIFVLENIEINRRLIAGSVCKDIIDNIDKELNSHTYSAEIINSSDVVKINPLVKIKK